MLRVGKAITKMGAEQHAPNDEPGAVGILESAFSV